MCSSRARRILAPRFAAIAPTPTRHGRTKASASEFPTGHIVDGRRRGRRDPCSRRPSPRVPPCGVARRERVANTASALRSEQWVRLTWELIGTTLQCEPVLSPAARRREGASPLPTGARRGLRKGNRAQGTGAAAGDDRRGAAAALATLRAALRQDRPAVDRAGEAAPSLAPPGPLHGPERAAAHGAAPVQSALPLVCRAEHG